MTDSENRLATALQTDSPPVRDASFRIDVLERLEQARFRRQVGRTVAVAAVVAVLAAVMTLRLDAWTSGDVLWIAALGAPLALFTIFAALRKTSTTVATVVRAVSGWLYP